MAGSLKIKVRQASDDWLLDKLEEAEGKAIRLRAEMEHSEALADLYRTEARRRGFELTEVHTPCGPEIMRIDHVWKKV